MSIGHPITNVDNPRLCYVPGPSLPYTFCRGGYKSVKRSDGYAVNSVNDQVTLCVVVPMYSSSFVTAVLLGPAP